MVVLGLTKHFLNDILAIDIIERHSSIRCLYYNGEPLRKVGFFYCLTHTWFYATMNHSSKGDWSMQCENLKDIHALLIRLSKNPDDMSAAADSRLSLIAQFQASELWLARTPDSEDSEEHPASSRVCTKMASGL